MSGDGEPTGGDQSIQQPAAVEAQQSKHHGTLIFVIVVVAIAAVIALVLALDLWNSDGDDNLVSVDTTEPTSTASVPNTTAPATAAGSTCWPALIGRATNPKASTR